MVTTLQDLDAAEQHLSHALEHLHAIINRGDDEIITRVRVQACIGKTNQAHGAVESLRRQVIRDRVRSYDA